MYKICNTCKYKRPIISFKRNNKDYKCCSYCYQRYTCIHYKTRRKQCSICCPNNFCNICNIKKGYCSHFPKYFCVICATSKYKCKCDKPNIRD